jgi:DNA repair exonuclease SbcCD nuclease subunit
MKKDTKTLVVGDPHFIDGKELEGREFVQKILQVVKKYSPTFVVLLGDILDKHGVSSVQPFNLVHDFLNELIQHTPTYVLMGNHDLKDNKQFCTEQHFFNPYKKWNNLYIVDKPLHKSINGKSFIFVPYVPPGRFIEALDILTLEEITWETADCIFAHQEFRNCKYGISNSAIGDLWDPDYPLVISGHIHIPEVINDNIFYPGSSMQHYHSDSEDKRIWLLDWNIKNKKYEILPKNIKINLGMKPKKLLKYNLGDFVENYESEETLKLKKYDVKIELTGTSAEFNHFRKSNIYQKLSKKDPNKKCVFSYKLSLDGDYSDDNNDDENIDLKNTVSYDKVFKDIVSKNDSILIRNEYEIIFGVKLSPTKK